MRCVDPFVKAGEVYPCGRCLPCKFRSRRIWFHRVLLEASQHDYSSVVTLTYDESALPEGGVLRSEHLRNWLKRFRKRAVERYPWRRLRFIACGEYGEKLGRPHFHVVLFGQPGCELGRTGRHWCGDCSCVNCSDVASTWPIGAASLEAFSRASAAYVAGYVTRKVLCQPLPGKPLPFMRQSNQPGIGANAVWDIADTMLRYGLEKKTLPTAISLGRRPMLLGRYLRRKLAEALDVPVPEPVQSSALQAVRDYAWSRSLSARAVLAEINSHYASTLYQREALTQKEKTL